MKTLFRVCGMAAVFAGFLTACGSGGGGGGGAAAPTSLSGVFADSPVAGLTYVIGGVSAKTDANGRFNYKAGDSITFRVGDIVLGTAVGKPFLSPVSLVPGAIDQTNATVTNLAKFLQTIDENNNPADGIQLTNAIHTAALGRSINFGLLTTADYDLNGNVAAIYLALNGAAIPPRAPVPVVDASAQSHLLGTLRQAMAGTYSGTYSGGGSGSFTFTINNAGAITSGQIVQPAPSPAIPIVGNIASSGNFASINNPGTLGGVAVNLSMNGDINVGTNTVSGTWTLIGGGYNFSGSFSGGK